MVLKRLVKICLGLILLVMLSCSKSHSSVENGITVYKNGSDKADPALKIRIRELFEIDNSPDDSLAFKKEIATFTLDDQNNIYLLDKKQSKVFKYDQTGKFLLAFGKRGNGPGEFIITDYLANMLWFDQHLQVLIPGQSEVKIFDGAGNFSHTQKTQPENMPFFVQNFLNNQILGASIMVDMTKPDAELQYNLVVFDSTYSLARPPIYSYGVIDQTKPDALFNLIPKVCLTSDYNLIVTAAKDSYYSLYLFDKKLVKTTEIRKSCIKQEFKPADIAKNRILNKELKGSQIMKYKTAVNGLFADSKNRIWVAVPVEDENDKQIHFDIFQDGIFLNNIALPLEVSNPDIFLQSDLKIIGDKIYVINQDNITLKCYQIEN